MRRKTPGGRVPALLFALICSPQLVRAQASPRLVGPVLSQHVQSPAITRFQLSQYLAARKTKLPAVTRAADCSAE
jgi:hypothetical protein